VVLVGGVDEISELIQRLIDVGIEYVIVYIPRVAYDHTPLKRFAQARGLDLGYAGYWAAAPLTWQMKAEVKVYPVQGCGAGNVCPFPFHKISSWYTPRPGRPSMLILDAQHPEGGAPPRAPDPAFGRPRETAQIGRLTVHVYPYDIASRFK
jgi:hypothetical protein